MATDGLTNYPQTTALHMNSENSKPTDSSESKTKKLQRLLLSYINQLAMALGVKMKAERSLLYVHALKDLNESQIIHGFELALKLFKPQYGQDFPSPAQFREWACEWRPEPMVRDARHILDRGDKPPDWEPVSAEDIEQLKEKVRLAAIEMAKRAGWL